MEIKTDHFLHYWCSSEGRVTNSAVKEITEQTKKKRKLLYLSFIVVGRFAGSLKPQKIPDPTCSEEVSSYKDKIFNRNDLNSCDSWLLTFGPRCKLLTWPWPQPLQLPHSVHMIKFNVWDSSNALYHKHKERYCRTDKLACFRLVDMLAVNWAAQVAPQLVLRVVVHLEPHIFHEIRVDHFRCWPFWSDQPISRLTEH